MSAAQLLCTHCAAEKWNLAAAELDANHTPENRAAAVAAMHEHKRAVVAAKSPALYAAAPELLAALEALLADVDYAMPHLPLGTIGLRRIRQAREAIAKAEGKP